MCFKLENENVAPKKSNDVTEILNKVKKNLNDLREEIRGDTLSKYSNEELTNFRAKFKKAYSEFDRAKSVEELEEDEQKEALKRFEENNHLIIFIEIQSLISRLTNKIQREEAKRLNFKHQEMLRANEEIMKDSNTLKESVITISSLVFTAFTFIQLNFVAFQNSKDYLVLDRIILFSGVNLFIIIGIYSILSMIKNLLSYNQKQNNNDLTNCTIISIFFILVFIFGASLWIKKSHETIIAGNYKSKTEKKLIELSNEIDKINNNKITDLKSKIKNIEIQINELEKQNNIIENKRLKLKEELLLLKDKNISKDNELQIREQNLNLREELINFKNH